MEWETCPHRGADLGLDFRWGASWARLGQEPRLPLLAASGIENS